MTASNEPEYRLGPEDLEAMGSSALSIEAFAVVDLCRGLEALQKRMDAGAVSAEEAEETRQRLLAENLAWWGRYSPCAESAPAV